MTMKTGIIIATHGELANELRNTSQMLFGRYEYLLPVCYLAEHSIDLLLDTLNDAINSLKELSGIIIFCDMKGGSPCNVAMRLAKNDPRITVISGINIPVLLETLSLADSESPEAVISYLDNILSHSIEILSKGVNHV